ncbi:MAG: hypothetical protein SP1CHLAM54_04070 [Chlamydiia bacterium]|nr:hypothetical protein [Chlamydiia bacterium]MCH9615322.1 hypothetical protein [Chlamydiia bacterium]MCH9628356.1 hypothetical protein [Chlamydiia bacterium]
MLQTAVPTLRQPADFVSGTFQNALNARIDNLCDLVTEVAIPIILCAILSVPALALWSISKAITLLTGNTPNSHISSSALGLKPDLIDLPTVEVARSVDFRELSNRFNERFPADDYAADCGALQHMCQDTYDWAQTDPETPRFSDTARDQLFYAQLACELAGLEQKLLTGTLPEDKVRGLLLRLAQGAGRCRPTWVEETHKVFLAAHVGDAAVQNLLSYVQTYKEQILLQRIQITDDAHHWHRLNDIRLSPLGDELGLDTSTCHLDIHARELGSHEVPRVRQQFMADYSNILRLLESIANSVNANADPFDQNIHTFVSNAVRNQGLHGEQSVEDFVADHCYDDEYQMTPQGAEIALVELGILVS